MRDPEQTQEAKTGELNPFPSDKPIVAYNEFRSQIAELQKLNDTIVFDYKDPKGNKEARSHVYAIRRTKSAIDAARKKENAAAVAYKKRVDSEAEELVQIVEKMIDVHQKPLDEIEAAEASRLEYIKSIISSIEATGEGISVLSSTVIAERLAIVEKLVIDDSFAEFLGDAAKAHDLALLRLKSQLPETQKREAEAKELEELRKMRAEKEAKEKEEKALQEAREREQAIENSRKAAEAKESEERAKREEFARIRAEEEAVEARQREEAAKIEHAARLEKMAKEAKEAAEKAEQEKIAAVAKAKKDAEEKAEREAAERQAAEKAEQEKREANKKHVAAINLKAATAIVELSKGWPAPIELGSAVALCETISHGNIPNTYISY